MDGHDGGIDHDGHGDHGGHGHGFDNHGHLGGGATEQAMEMAEHGGHGDHGHGHIGGHDIGGHIGHASGHADHHGGYVTMDSAGGFYGFGHCHFAFGHLHSALSCMGIANGTEDSCGRKVRLPGVAWNDTVIQVLAWPHGNCSVADLLRKLAPKLGLYNLAKHKADLIDDEKVEKTLIDTTPFDGRQHNSPMPSGWYPDATGFTRTFKQYWQLGKRTAWWEFWEPAMREDPTQRVHIAVQGATWFFKETGDFETRVAFLIKSRKVLVGGKWEHDMPLGARHHTAARVLADQLLTAIKEVPSSSSAVLQRKLISSSRPSTTVTTTVPTPVKPGGPAPKVLPVTNTGGPDPIAFDLNP